MNQTCLGGAKLSANYVLSASLTMICTRGMACRQSSQTINGSIIIILVIIILLCLLEGVCRYLRACGHCMCVCVYYTHIHGTTAVTRRHTRDPLNHVLVSIRRLTAPN